MTHKDKQDVIAVCNILADKMSDGGKVAVQQIIDAVNDMVENEPCEDCISRETLRLKLEEHHDFIVNSYDGLYKPQKYKARVDEINKCIAMVVNAPSVTPKQKTGKWIKWYEILKCDGYEDHLPHWKCSECEQEVSPYSAGFINYCPNCGAKMEVE